MLSGDRERDLRHEAVDLQINNASGELVASADTAEIVAASGGRALRDCGKEAVDLGFGDPVMATLGLHCLDLALVDPLLQGWIADAKNLAGIAHRIKFWS